MEAVAEIVILPVQINVKVPVQQAAVPVPDAVEVVQVVMAAREPVQRIARVPAEEVVEKAVALAAEGLVTAVVMHLA